MEQNTRMYELVQQLMMCDEDYDHVSWKANQPDDSYSNDNNEDNSWEHDEAQEWADFDPDC